MDWLDRASLLGAQLRAAPDLEAGRAYPAAFSIIRTVLEHHLIDRLIVLGHQWRQEVRVAPPRDPDEYESQLQAAEARGTIVNFTRTSERRFLVVRKAPHFENDPDEWISTYSEWAEHYNPFSGPPNVQDQLIGAFMDVADRTRLARESHELRERVFSFRALREHLDLNGLLGPVDAIQLGIHYGFLSAFTHPTAAGYSAALGRHRPRSAAYDHYCSELLALYVCRIACLEIGVVREGLARKPQCGLARASEVDRLVDETVERIDHFWFFGGSPTDYDRVMTANYLTNQTLDENFRYRKWSIRTALRSTRSATSPARWGGSSACTNRFVKSRPGSDTDHRGNAATPTGTGLDVRHSSSRGCVRCTVGR